jgi:hypothetical protein
MQVVSLKCASCGSDLQIGPDVEHFACAYCGSSQAVHRDGGIITLKAVEAAIAKVQLGADRTAAELAIHRLREDLEDVKAQIRRLIETKVTEKEEVRSFLLKVASVVAVISFLIIVYYSAALALIWGGVVLVTAYYVIARTMNGIDRRYQGKLDAIFDKQEVLKKHLADKMRIVE